MKITLTHDDVIAAVRGLLGARRLSTPPPTTTGAYQVLVDSEGLVEVIVNGIDFITKLDEPEPLVNAMPEQPRERDRFDPGPPPPRNKLDAPDRSLDDGSELLPTRVENEKSIRSMVSQSRDLVSRTPDPTKHTASRERFPRVLVAEAIEDFGKEPSDYKDEL